jgi:histidine triad (HIT) family protein
MPSIFTKIIHGELPSYKIFEDPLVFAFLSIDPIRPGHTLIVPKVEIDHFTDLADPYYSAVYAAAKPIGRALLAATGCRRVGMAVQGFEVPHFHLHLIPMWSPADFDFRNAKRLPEAEMKDVQAKIVAKLKA